MADLQDVLGGILKSIAHSRVVSDVFTRDASLEYRRDPLLSDLSVPRIDIRSVEVTLRFAVRSIESVPVDRAAIVRSQLAGAAADTGADLYRRLVEASPARERLTQAEETERLDLRASMAESIQRMATDTVVVTALASGDASAVSSRLGSALRGILVDDPRIRGAFGRGAPLASARADVNRAASDAAEALAARAIEAVEAAARQPPAVSIAVTPEELANVPTEVVSELRLVADMRNYEVTLGAAEDGTMEPHLRLE